MDLAVKHRFFKHLYGSEDPEAEQVYRLHIEARSGPRMEAGLATDKWKTQTDDYVSSATGLFKSMSADGFDPEYPVPIDPDGELLDGSHRVACALALTIPHIVVELRPEHVWAPAWDYLWFLENMPRKKYNKRILMDWIEQRLKTFVL
jgi:hypothetical protein